MVHICRTLSWWATWSVTGLGMNRERELIFSKLWNNLFKDQGYPEWSEEIWGANGIKDVNPNTDLSFSLSLPFSVFQVSSICVRVFAACRCTEISTDLPVRGKKLFQSVHDGDDSDSPSIVWLEFTLYIYIYCSGFKELLSNNYHKPRSVL